jgi:peptide-methionine (S)-S-oxide reductase
VIVSHPCPSHTTGTQSASHFGLSHHSFRSLVCLGFDVKHILLLLLVPHKKAKPTTADTIFILELNESIMKVLFSSLLMFAIASSSTTRAFIARSNNLTHKVASAAQNSTTKRTMIANILDLLGGGGGDKPLISKDDALPGRATKMANIDGLRHAVLGNKLEEVPDGYKVAVFANGCFWGSEKGIWRLPGNGIHSTAVGYCAGYTPNPTYEEACSGRTGHTEGVRVVYDPSKISFVDIMRWFWEAHDPCSGMGQGNDRGTQYRSGFYYFDDEQKQLIESSKIAYENALNGGTKPITTEIASANDYDQLWYFGESYHQQYLAKPGAR